MWGRGRARALADRGRTIVVPSVGHDVDTRTVGDDRVRRRNRYGSSKGCGGRSQPLEIIVIKTLVMILGCDGTGDYSGSKLLMTGRHATGQ